MNPTMNLLIATAEQQLDAIADNAFDLKTVKDYYDYDYPTSLANAIDDSLKSVQYAKNNLDKLASVLRLIGAEMLLQSEGYKEND